MDSSFFINALTSIARAGGGGSSSGGGGGDFLAMLTWVPSHWLAARIKRMVSFPVAMAITISGAVIVTLFIAVFFIFNGFLIGYLGYMLIFGIWCGWATAMFDIWHRMKKRIKKANADLAVASQNDTVWNEPSMHRLVRDTFERYQQHWSVLDSSHFSDYMTAYYTVHAGLIVRALREMGRQNIIENPQILKIDTIEIHDDTDNNKDWFTVMIEAKATDRLYDLAAQKNLFVTNEPFTEFWTFVRDNSTWRLDRIDQTTAAHEFASNSIAQFANENNMYYSLDWGRLLVPHRGSLFNGTDALKTADINNHMIGLWNDHLVQIYTYRYPYGRDNVKQSFIAQINLPKSYGGIIIERRKSFLQRAFSVNGKKSADGLRYEKYEYEWPDFNKRYDVWATDQSRLASFELLNPGFMQYLYDCGLTINIEVVDNIVYLWHDKEPTTEQYPVMFEVLTRAFKELKL